MVTNTVIRYSLGIDSSGFASELTNSVHKECNARLISSTSKSYSSLLLFCYCYLILVLAITLGQHENAFQ